MDFTEVDLSAEDAAFQRELRAFLSEIVTEEVILRDRQTGGDNFDEGVHLALGARGLLEKEYKTGTDEGFSRVQRRIWDLERRRAHVPWVTWGDHRDGGPGGRRVRQTGPGRRGHAEGVRRHRPNVPGLHRT